MSLGVILLIDQKQLGIGAIRTSYNSINLVNQLKLIIASQAVAAFYL